MQLSIGYRLANIEFAKFVYNQKFPGGKTMALRAKRVGVEPYGNLAVTDRGIILELIGIIWGFS